MRNSRAQRDVRKLKNELESTSDSLDETQKRLKSVKLERDSLQEDFEGAGKKIDQLKLGTMQCACNIKELKCT